MKKYLYSTGLFLLSLVSINGFGQVAAEKSALHNMEKLKWSKAKTRLEKSLAKDSIDAGAQYILARYFFSPANPDYNLDSAYHFINATLRNFQSASEKEVDRLRKIPLDSSHIHMLRYQIDSAAFERAKTINTEKAYSFFLDHFATAPGRDRAIELRYEAAYIDALKMNTYEAFAYYLQKYPNTSRANEAKARYELLLFDDKTHDKRLTSFEAFVKEYPESSYRSTAERNILLLTTASGSLESYKTFLADYPQSTSAAFARDILFHLYIENDLDVANEPLLKNDSLVTILNLNRKHLVPFVNGNRFGFMDNEGNKIIDATETEIRDEYLCGNIVEDLLFMGDRLIARNNATLYEGGIDELNELGYGFLEIIKDGCSQVLHKSGRMLKDSCMLGSKIIGGKFLAIKKETGWRLFTLTFMPLPVGEWEDVKAVNDALALMKNGVWFLTSPEALAAAADQDQFILSEPVDKIEPWPADHIWVKHNDVEGLMDAQLHFKIPMKKQQLVHRFYGIQATSDEGVKLYDDEFGETVFFQRATASKPWIVVKLADRWSLYENKSRKFLSIGYDTVQFAGVFAVGLLGDSMVVHCGQNKSLGFKRAAFDFIPSKDSTAFMWIENGDKKTVYDAQGKALFTFAFDKIAYHEQGIFIVSRKEKKGLLKMDGTQLLNVEYDAIGDITGNWVPLLKNMKFGFYDLTTGKEVRPMYDKNMKRYNDHYVVAFKAGAYGLITLDNKPKSKFEFEEIVYWNDTSAWVKKNFQWMLIDIESGKIVLDKIKDFKWVNNNGQEKVAIVHQENMYGVFSNRRGAIIPPTFTDILNLGTQDDPLYFTEKNVEEASIFVVIYYNSDGKLIHRQAFDEDVYDRIYCSNN